MHRPSRVLSTLTVLLLAALGLAAQPASAATKPLSIPIDVDADVLGAPASIDATLSITLETTTGSFVFRGQFQGVLTVEALGLTVTANTGLALTVTPTCGTTQASLSVDLGTFDVLVNGVTRTIDLNPLVVSAGVDTRLGEAICGLVEKRLEPGTTLRAATNVVTKALAAR